MADVSVFAWHQFRFLAVGENHRHLRSARTRALGLVRGHQSEAIVSLTRDVYRDDIVPNLLSEMVDRAKNHVAQGHEVWLVTATPTVLAEVIVEGIGVTGALGTGSRSQKTVGSPAKSSATSCGPEKAGPRLPTRP